MFVTAGEFAFHTKFLRRVRFLYVRCFLRLFFFFSLLLFFFSFFFILHLLFNCSSTDAITFSLSLTHFFRVRGLEVCCAKRLSFVIENNVFFLLANLLVEFPAFLVYRNVKDTPIYVIESPKMFSPS